MMRNQTPRTVLLIEDSAKARRNLKWDLQEASWRVVVAYDTDSALHRLEEAHATNRPIDAIAMDLGLPPMVDRPLKGGIPLAEKLRAHDDALPILAYTGLAHGEDSDYSLLVAKLLPLRISFAYSRRFEEEWGLPEMLDLVWRGFFILSPAPARHLVRTAAHRPDPLEDKHWEALKWFSRDYTYRQTASAIPSVNSEETIRSWFPKMRQLLYEAGELGFEPSREEIISWYRQNRIRYRRGDEFTGSR